MSQAATFNWRILLPAVVLAVVGAAHSSALDGAFIWDDEQLIENNEYIRDFDQLGQVFFRDFWQVSAEAMESIGPQANTYYRPMVTLSYMVDHALWGQDPPGYHQSNILLHLAVVLLVYWLSRRLLPDPWWAAAPVALLFGLHPSRAESVCWISGRTDVLMALFAISAVLFFLRALERRELRPLALTAAWVCLVLAMTAKESAIGLVVAVPALDALLVSRWDRGRLMRNGAWCHGPLILVGVIYLVFRFTMISGSAAGGGPSMDLGRHILTVFMTVGHYCAALLNPYNPSMQLGPHAHLKPIDWAMASIGIVATIGFLASLAISLRRSALAAMGLIFFAAFLAPVLNLVPLGLRVLAAERNLYLPMFGVGLLLSLPLSRGGPAAKPRPLLAAALALLSISWGGALFIRGIDFTDPARFWETELERSIGNPAVEMKLAHELEKAGQRERARMLRLSAWRNLDQLRVFGAPRVDLFVRLLEAHYLDLGPHGAGEKFILARVLAGMRASASSERQRIRIGGQELAISLSDPGSQLALAKRRGGLLSLEGSILSQLGNDPLAVKLLHSAVGASPGRIEVRMNLLVAQLRSLDLGGARKTALGIQGLADAQGFSLPPSLGPLLARSAPVITRLRSSGLSGDLEQAGKGNLWRLGQIYNMTGAAMRARAVLRVITRRFPGDRGAWAALAQDLAAAGQQKEALQVIAAARARFGVEPGLEALEKKVRALKPAFPKSK